MTPRSTGRSLFGTDGIRGVANVYPMTPELALSLGRAVTFVAGRGRSHTPRVLIGKDTRLSGYMLETAIASGITSMGGRVLLCGPVPTPAVAHLTVSMRADAGIVISASHNPYDDNGIKIFGADGFKLPDAAEAEIETLLREPERLGERRTGPAIGRAVKLEDARGRYVAFVKATFPRDLTLDGMRVVVDAAHGAAYVVAPLVFSELGAKVHAIGVRPNGTNINREVGALHPDHARAEVVRRGASIGIALDGDADRLIVIDEKGQLVDGDAVMAMCATRMKLDRELRTRHGGGDRDEQPGPRARARGPGHHARAHAGRRPLRGRGHAPGRLQPRGRAVGPRDLPRPHLDRRRPDRRAAGAGADDPHRQAALGAGPRGHGARAAGRRERDARRAQAARGDGRPCRARSGGIRGALGKDGRVIVRWSGTEPKLRVMVEGPDEPRIATMAQDLVAAARKDVG